MEFKLPTIEEMLEAGVHFGHQSRRWNPVMAKFIYEKDNGSHVIDIYKTEESLKRAAEFLYEVSKNGRQIVFVGTKRQARSVIEQIAKDTNSLFVVERWLGGTFTNYNSIERNIKELDKLIADKKEGKFTKYTKKERLLLDRKIAKLERFYGGLRGLQDNPGAIVVVDVKKEITAVREAKAINVPVVGLVDTNSDPTLIDFVIPSNDDAIKSIRLILNCISQGINEGKKLAPKIEPKPVVEDKPKTDSRDPRSQRPYQGNRPNQPFRPGQKPFDRRGQNQNNQLGKSDTKTSVNAQTRPESKPVAKAEVKADVKTESKPEVKSEAKTSTKPEVKKDVKSKKAVK